MASIHIGDGKGVTFPNWLLGAVCAAFLATSMTVSGTAIVTWAKVDEASQKNAEQDRRLDNLENMKTDIASMKAEVSATHDLAAGTNAKLDRLIDRNLEDARHGR